LKKALNDFFSDKTHECMSRRKCSQSSTTSSKCWWRFKIYSSLSRKLFWVDPYLIICMLLSCKRVFGYICYIRYTIFHKMGW